MRIGIDMLGAQAPESRGRGIGRYTRNLVSSLLAIDPSNEYVLYYYAGLPMDPIGNSQQTGIRVVGGGGSAPLSAVASRLAQADPDRLDLLLITCPFGRFRGYAAPAKPLGHPKMAAILYDVIPALYQQQYLSNPRVSRWYYRTLETIGRYDLLLAISDATKRDCERLLPAKGPVVLNAGCASDSSFFAPATNAASTQMARDQLSSLGIRLPFVFNVGGGLEWRKNYRGLVEAFAMLPEVIRTAHQLVVTCAVADKEAAQMHAWASEHGVEEQLVLTNTVSDTVLRTLYQRCAVFLFPSIYEGFGLPILEALHCGAAVIAGNNSSQIEVVGDAGLLANVHDPADLSLKLCELLEDSQRACALRARAPIQARKFHWRKTAQRVVEQIEAVCDRRGGDFSSSPVVEHASTCQQQPRFLRRANKTVLKHENRHLAKMQNVEENVAGSERVPLFQPAALSRSVSRHRISPQPRLAYFSPLPPKQSGISDYSMSLVSELKKHYAIDLFHDSGYTPHASLSSCDLRSYDYRLFDRFARIADYVGIVYQMGNSEYHRFVYETLLRHPGIVTLHDLSLAGFHRWYAMQPGTGADHLRRELAFEKCDRHPALEPLLRERPNSPSRIAEACVSNRVYLNRRIFANSTCVVVHSAWCLKQIQRYGAGDAASAVVIPQGATVRTASSEERQSIRDRFKLSRDALVCASFGSLHPTKLNLETIDAFAPFSRAHPEALLLFVGADMAEGEAAAKASALGIGHRVRFFGHQQNVRDFCDLVTTTDIGISLRRPPTNGETSAALLRLLGAGVATIISDVDTMSTYPDDVVFKVPYDATIVDSLQHGLHSLAKDRQMRERIGRAAQAYVRELQEWPRVASQYARVIDGTQQKRQLAQELLCRPTPEAGRPNGVLAEPFEHDQQDPHRIIGPVRVTMREFRGMNSRSCPSEMKPHKLACDDNCAT